MTHLEHAKEFWKIAQTFPQEKEKVYPGHAAAFCLEEHRDRFVLEYACGGGSDTISLLRRGARVWFTDIVKENVICTDRRVREAFNHDPEVQRRATPVFIAQSAEIGLAPQSFDVVTCNGCLHHIPEPVPVMREFHRLLRLNGLAFIMLYTEDLEARCMPVMQGLMDVHNIPQTTAFGWVTDGAGCPYARSYTIEQALETFEPLGFICAEVRPYNNGDFRVFQFVKRDL